MLQEIKGLGASSQTDTFAYYQTGCDSNLLEQANYANGDWQYYVYDEYGRVTNLFSAYNNSPSPTSGMPPDPLTIHCKLTKYVYCYASLDPNAGGPAIGSTVDPLNSRTTEVDIPVQGSSGWALHTVSFRTDYVDKGFGMESYTYIDTSPGASDDFSLFTGTIYGWNAFNVPSPEAIQYLDGSQSYIYYNDQFTTVEDDPDDTETTTIVDILGNPLSKTRVDLDTGVTLSALTYTYSNAAGVCYDQLLRSHDVTDLAGRVTQYRYNDCCGSYTMTDPDGKITEHDDDLLKRPVATTVYYGGTAGIMNSNALDASGRILATTRTGTDGTSATIEQNAYDLLGNRIALTNALGGVTTVTNVIINNQLYITNTYANGATRIETYYRDGRLQSVAGTAVHPVEYLYGVEQDSSDGAWREYTQTIKLTPTGGTNEWTKTYVDGAGNQYKTIYSTGSGSNPYSESYYNEYGQCWKKMDPDGVTTLYIYDENGDLGQGKVQYVITALSSTALAITSSDDLLGQLGTLEGDGIDRIQMTDWFDAAGSGGMPDVTGTEIYTWLDGETDSTGTQVATSQSSTDGLQAWKITFGGSSRSVTNYTASSPGTNRTELTMSADNSYVVSAYSFGQIVGATRYDSTGNQIGGTTFGYDSVGRQNAYTDARNGTTTVGYNNADLATTNTTPNPANRVAPETTVTAYDDMLEVTNVAQPDGTTVISSYLPTGELGRQYGSRAYPVAYGYDYAGRLNAMTNWSGFNSGGASTGSRATLWNYDAYRGFLTSKTYADGSGPSYTYTPGGRLATRVWARGITTDYLYDPAGELTNVVYSDATDGITNTYDRLSHLTAIQQGAMIDTLSNDWAGDLLSESFSGGPLNGPSVTNGYDQFLRRTNLTALAASLLTTTTYGYDDASRLLTVNDGNANTATYSYLANAPLVGQIVFANSGATRMTTTKQYDYLNRLTQISSAPSAPGLLPLAYSYSYNTANQRTQNTFSDGSHWVYQYDSLGQVISGKRYWSDGTPVAGQQFDYTFDTIGNRTQTQTGGDTNGAGLRVANYYANNLNQITNRDIPPYVDVMGASLLTNTVTVNGQTAYRNQEYFRAQIPANNATTALWTNIIVSGGQSVTGNVYVAQEPEQLKYDADGNLTNDGRWYYTWDAENRLIGMIVNTNVGPQYQLTFAYDFEGRRIQKTVVSNSVPLYTNTFLYDNWNLIALLAPGSQLQSSFVWGTDLSGTLQGAGLPSQSAATAGGVGGLLETSYHGTSTTNAFVAYDGNGNISALINAADGSILANYDYGPFGEVIRSTGPMAKNNPFRFSTKYQDDETDFLYYGYRYYSPSTGRWLSRDPLEEADGPAIYAYTHNDPTDFADPFGLSCSTYRYEFELGKFFKWIPGMQDATQIGKLAFRAQLTRCDACCSGKGAGHDVQFSGGVFGKLESPKVRPISWLPIVYLQADVSANFNVQISHKFCPDLWSGGGCGTIQIGGKVGLDLPRGWSASGGISGGCQLCVKADRTSSDIQVTLQCFASEQIQVQYRFFRHSGSYMWLWQQSTSPSEIASFSVD